MIYSNIPFIDLQHKIIKYSNMKSLDFSASIILDKAKYVEFVCLFYQSTSHQCAQFIFSYLDQVTINDKIAILSFLYSENNVSDFCYIHALQNFIHRPELYFLCLLTIHSRENKKNIVEKQHKNYIINHYEQIDEDDENITINEIQLIDNIFYDDMINLKCHIAEKLWDIDYVVVDDKKYCTIDYVKLRYNNTEIIQIMCENFMELQEIVIQKPDIAKYIPHLYYNSIYNRINLVRQDGINELENLFSNWYLFFLLPADTHDNQRIQLLFKQYEHCDLLLTTLIANPVFIQTQTIKNPFSTISGEITKEFNYPNCLLLDNIILENLLTSDNIITLKFYDYYRLLFLCDNLSQYGVMCYNMDRVNLASRLASFVNDKVMRHRFTHTYQKQKAKWLISNFQYVINCADNRDYLTPSAHLALHSNVIDLQLEYGQETNKDSWLVQWQLNNIPFLLFKLQQKILAFTASEIMANISVDGNQIYYNIQNVKHVFSHEDLLDLQLLLTDVNCDVFNTLLCKVNNVISNSCEGSLENFHNQYNSFDETTKHLIKQYFVCYFLLLNYIRGWPGPPYDITKSYNNKLQNVVRAEFVNLMIATIQQFSEQIANVWAEKWDHNLRLMTRPNKILRINMEQHANVLYDSNSIRGRLELLSRGLFCAGVFCETSMLYINAIMGYLQLNTEQINNVIQEESKQIYQYILQRNNFNSCINNHELSGNNIYKYMFNYYHLLMYVTSHLIPNSNMKNIAQYSEKYLTNINLPIANINLLVPLFIMPHVYNKLKKVNGKLQVPKQEVVNCLSILGFSVNLDNPNLTYELFTKAYQYYFDIYMYISIKNYKEIEIPHISMYDQVQHTTIIEDSKNILQYVDYI